MKLKFIFTGIFIFINIQINAQEFKIEHLLVEGKTKVTIDTSGVKEYTHFTISDPERIVIDLYNAKNELIIKARDIVLSPGGKISRVRAGQFNPQIVRIVIELNEPFEYEMNKNDKQFVVAILETKRAVVSQKEPAITKEPEESKLDNYVLRSGDALSILVSPAEEVSKEVTIQPDGMITLLYVGAIRVAGLTLTEFKKVLIGKLKQYVNSPKVIVTVRIFAGSKIFITGTGVSTGSYEYKNGLKLLELISQAGGFKEKADRKNIKITRIIEGIRQVIPINAIELQEQGQDFSLSANDEIEVSAIKGEIYVYGEVRSPGTYEFKENYRLVELIAKAGGFTEIASINKVKILRGNPQTMIEVDVEKALEVGLQNDTIMEIGDVVIVGRTGLSTWNFILNNVVPTITLLTTLVGLFILLKR